LAWWVIVGYEGNADLVNWQVQQLVKELGTGHSLDARVGAPAQPWWHALVAWQAWPEAHASFKANVPPSAVASLCLACDPRLHVKAHAGSGIAWAHVPAGLGREEAPAALEAWRKLAAQHGGTVVVPRCPPDWKSAMNVWGPPPPDAWLMRSVKRQIDPRGLFNPGRFVDGI
jgi:glycolate oxidase FAD binding subunit